ncbi:MAG: hypothetical protein A4E72_00351 [Syntrophus sp. PtaU1.Bin208]|nr:MAG: hypothetical protein A4E72_00351 [Syntrophus sp. PtaU1.Bin208]
MRKKFLLTYMVLISTVATALILGMYNFAAAHCDTMDGPVISDARKALDTGDVTPVLKWVRQNDEKEVCAAFAKARKARGKKNAGSAETQFFEKLVRIHRAGEGAPFTGLKPAGEIEPAIAEADKALASGSSDALVKLITDDAAAGIRKRYEKAAVTFKHKDESVEKGREFVEAYVEYTHYVERLHLMALGQGGHGEHSGHPAAKHGSAPHHTHGH